MNKQPESAFATRPGIPPPLPVWKRHKTLLKMASLALLTLLLMIPLGLVDGVLNERMHRRNNATIEMASSWGGAQTVVGPVLTVPYKYRHMVRRETMVNGRLEWVEVEQTDVADAHFLPSSLRVEGTLDPSVLHRGIYEAVVYRGGLNVSGSFEAPVFAAWGVSPEDILWDSAYVSLSITDLRGAQEELLLTWGEKTLPLVPGTGLPGFTSGVRAVLAGVPRPGEKTDFSIKFSLNGSDGIRFAPLGARNEVNLTSPWPDPSFQGANLPIERDVSADGFKARWQASYYGRSYPQQWSSRDASAFAQADVLRSSFGVDLIAVVDSYRHVERAIKYGVLFIVMVFAAFFLFELLAGLQIHSFQYTLVGAALCLFYLALLSLSEFLSFSVAYAAGATASTVMIALYCARILRSGKRASIVAAELGLIYGILFVILRLQDYSLLFGTAGLFATLGIVMFATRNIDWYARDEECA